MENNKIVFCTLAYGTIYREKSLTLIKSIMQNCPDYKLVVATDHPEYYKNFEREINLEAFKLQLKLSKNSDIFPYSAKLFPIEYCIKNYSPECIIYQDADNIITRSSKMEDLLVLDEGVSVVPHIHMGIESVDNDHIRRRVEKILQEGEFISIFPEQSIILRVNNKELATRFIDEWKSIYNFSMERELYQHGECIDIGIACQRSGYPLNCLKNSKMRDTELADYYNVFNTFSRRGELTRTLV